jgi:8-oxo-dGTP diphosphatase
MHVNARAIIEKVTPHGREIVLQTRDKPHEGRKWLELPGGRVEEFESITAALKREVLEETGLELTEVEGESSKVEAVSPDTSVECLAPFAVYQTTLGPVDSMGVYFRCTAKGQLLAAGDDAEAAQWIPVDKLRVWLEIEPERFSWIDRAGLLFYLRKIS